MKTHPYLPTLLSILFLAGITVHAQEDAEVDQILSEITTDSETSTETATVTEEVAPAEETSEATDLPAVTLEDAERLDGVTISGAENINEGLVSISYTDVALADLVRIFAQSAGANIIIPEGLDQKASGNLNDVFWKDALKVILKDKGYVLVERESGIYTITLESELKAEPLRSETLEFEYITAADAQPAVQAMLVNSNATATALKDNFLVVKESPAQLEEIKNMVKKIDRPRKQVFIEAKFVELNDSAIKDLGINWEVLQGYTIGATGLSTQYERIETRSSQDAQVTSNSRSNTSLDTRSTTDDFLDDDPDPTIDGNIGTRTRSSGSFDGLVQGRNFDSFDPDAGTITSIPTLEQTVTKSAVLSAEDFALTLSALQQLDGTRIVSNPKMLVANGQTATIHVGRNEPNVIAVPQGDNATTFAYVLDGFIEIGVKLEVTPTISTDKNITINIIPELSRLLGEKSVGEAGTTFPITQIRKINTEFAVSSGKTVAIGGLTQTEEKEEVNKVPLLGDLPIIGKYLFTHTHTEEIQDEIIIFVTVNSVNSTEDMNDRDGIPEDGKLIHTWLDLRKADSEENVEE